MIRNPIAIIGYSKLTDESMRHHHLEGIHLEIYTVLP